MRSLQQKQHGWKTSWLAAGVMAVLAFGGVAHAQTSPTTETEIPVVTEEGTTLPAVAPGDEAPASGGPAMSQQVPGSLLNLGAGAAAASQGPGARAAGDSDADSDEGAKSGDTATTAPYLVKDRKIQVFDPPQTAKLKQLREAAQNLLDQSERQVPLPRALRPRLATYQYEMTGKNEASIMQAAELRALESAVGRIYFDNAFLLGRELLKPYLARDGAQYMVRKDVLGRRLLGNGQTLMKVKLSVDLAPLYRDLSTKRFIAEPNLRPIAVVSLDEKIAGREDTSAEGRRRIEQTMQDHLFQIRTREMTRPAMTLDLSTSPGALMAARLEAERHNADIIITGTLEIRPLSQTEVLFDTHAFAEATINLKMYRADNGELLDSVSDEYSASGTSRDNAISNLLDALVTRASQKLADSLAKQWGEMMLDDSACRLLISGVSPQQQETISDTLKRFSPDVKIVEKSYYGNVWVVNLVMPKGQRDELENFLQHSSQPAFYVKKLDEQHYELELI